MRLERDGFQKGYEDGKRQALLDGNPKEWYNGGKCEACGMNAVYNGKCLMCEIEKKEIKKE